MSRELAAGMLAAAEVLEAVSGLYDAAYPAKYEWSAEDLRREAKHVEMEPSL